MTKTKQFDALSKQHQFGSPTRLGNVEVYECECCGLIATVAEDGTIASAPLPPTEENAGRREDCTIRNIIC